VGAGWVNLYVSVFMRVRGRSSLELCLMWRVKGVGKRRRDAS